MINSLRKDLKNSKLIVIKVGSSSLVDITGKIQTSKIENIARQISSLSGKQVIIVTSGAIAAGSEKLNLLGKLKTVTEKQAAAAIGQNLLMNEYEKAFSKFGLIVGQVLLTADAFKNKERHTNSKNAISKIIEFGAIPVINENDTVAVDEIKFGDNDTLSALVASLMDADLLILLSDVEGYFSKGVLVNAIEKITKEIEAEAKGSSSKFGTGGMNTKISAAKIAGAAGIPVVIASHKKDDVIISIINGDMEGTLFLPKVK